LKALAMAAADLFKHALCALYRRSGAARLQEALARWAGRPGRMAVLLFHRVTDAVPEDGLTVGTARFRRICGLLRNRFRVAPLAEVFRLARGGGPVPPRTVAVTFDDGYRDNLGAAETLAEHGLPACFFVSTAYVGAARPFPWDAGLPRMPNLTWDDVRRLAALGHEIGSHTVTHANLGAASPEDVRRELAESKAAIEREVGRPVRWLAYPYGGPRDARPGLAALAAEAGYEGCVSGHGGLVRAGGEQPILPRVPAPPFAGLDHLELHLSGCLEWIYALKRGLSGRGGAEAGRPDGAGLPPAEKEVCQGV
jgi:peptidoglycan/xylan/chitin deacetylase (PgdA/CDA1 family)